MLILVLTFQVISTFRKLGPMSRFATNMFLNIPKMGKVYHKVLNRCVHPFFGYQHGTSQGLKS